MKISYNWLKEYVSPLPKPEKLADLLTMHSFETESDGDILNIDVLPNRAHDCLSYIGVARECHALLNSKFEYRNPKLKENKNLKTKDFIKVEVRDNKACPRYTARVIANVKVGPSPQWLRNKLELMEQKSINNVVDATNYVMFETGQPLHAFDFDKISGSKIIVRRAKKNEKITTLDNENCKLDEDILVIADGKEPLALAGVKGGKKAEITNKTKTIVLESANFDYHAVRATSRKTGIRTESSLRFEHELDPNLTNQAIDRVASLIQEIVPRSAKRTGTPAAEGDLGAVIAKEIVDIYPKKVLSQKINLDLEKAEKLLGIKVSKQNVIKYLKSLDFEIDNSLKVAVPTFRQDIKIQEDLIEEIGRLIGYEKISAKAPLGLLGIAKLDEVLSFTNKIKTILEGYGFIEVYNPSFVGEGGSDYLELENPLSLDLKYLRKDLLINLLKNLKDNIKSFDNIKIFELGKTYRKTDKITEEKMLAGLMFDKGRKEEKFYELKGVIDGLFNKSGITDQWYDDFQATPEWTDEVFWQKGSTAEIKAGDEEIGFMGALNSKILNNLKIKGDVVAFSLNFEKIINLAREELIYQPPSSYPAAVRDLAILVNHGDRVADVLNAINDVGGSLVQDVDLFDMYEGEKIPQGKKNLAFHIIYQSDKKTLTDEEVDKIQKRIIKALEKKQGWQVRKQ